MDGELDLAHALGVERHLDDCPACTQTRDELLALRTLVQSVPRFRAPDALHQRVQAALTAPRPSRRRAFPWRRYLVPLTMAASLALVFALGWWTARVWCRPTAGELLAQQVVASHVRSLMAEHLLDVASTNRHTVKPWFLGRVNFSPDVPDLAGFELIGGRLDFLDERPAAALVYKRRDHVINVFLTSADEQPNTKIRFLNVRGFHLLHWIHAGRAYWAVSDLNEEELREFVSLFQSSV